MNRTVRGLVGASAVSVAAGLVVGLLPVDSWFVDLFANFRVPLTAICIALAAPVVVLQERWLAGLLAGVAVAAAVTEFRHTTSATPSDAKLIEVLSYNLNLGRVPDDVILTRLFEGAADIVILQEVTPAWRNALANMDRLYQHRFLHAREDSFGIAMLSRLPLEERRLRFLPGDIPYLSATVTVEGTDIRIFGVHLEWPVTPSSYRLRNEQILTLAAEFVATGGPMLVCGDFNLTPQSRQFRRFQSQTGFRGMPGPYRLNGSWPAPLPILRIAIDHCLTSDALGILGYSVGPWLGSDHRPLSVTVGGS